MQVRWETIPRWFAGACGFVIWLVGAEPKVNAEPPGYVVLPSQHQAVIAGNGIPLASHVAITLTPDPAFFPWIPPGTATSRGLNFEIAPSYLAQFSDCFDTQGHLNGLHGTLGVRFFDNSDSEGPNKLAYAMTHGNWFFHSDEVQVSKFLSSDSNHLLSREPSGRIVNFRVGKDGAARLVFYRSATSVNVLGLCVKTDLESRPVCDTVVNTDAASFDVDIDEPVLDREQRIECLVRTLMQLQQDVGIQEIRQ